MTLDRFIAIGKVHSPQGVRGDVFVSIFAGEADWAEQWCELLLAEDGASVPVQKINIIQKRVHQKQKRWGYVLKLEGFEDMNQAETLKGLTVFVPEDFITSGEGEEIYLREVMGFEVVDVQRGLVGKVVGFSGSDFQDILVIENSQGEKFEVPFVEPLLLEIDKKQGQLSMDIPQGLVVGEEL